MQNKPTTNSLWVLSDLHLAPDSDLLEFHAHEHLVSLLDYITAQPGQNRLILNGDIFDFLQLPGYKEISLPLAADRMTTILDALDSEPPPRNIIQALRRLTQAGHALHCLPGNHDPELNLFSVQKILAARVGSNSDIPPDQGIWHVHVCGNAKVAGSAAEILVTGMHGHWKDVVNAIPASVMQAAQRNGDAAVSMPPGSRLVRDVINPYRRAIESTGERRFPFIDLLPSEPAVILALLYLDPMLAIRRVKSVLGIAPQAFARKVGKFMRPGGKLAATAQPEQNATEYMVDELAGMLADAMNDGERHAEQVMLRNLVAYLETDSASKPIPAGGMLAANGSGGIRDLFLRSLCKALRGGHSALDPSQPDSLANDAMQNWGKDRIAVAGHTHAAKRIEHGNGAVYLNTGTWQDLMRIPDDLSETAVAVWLESLQTNEIERWQRCPVARISTDGALLFHWDGRMLQDWECAT